MNFTFKNRNQISRWFVAVMLIGVALYALKAPTSKTAHHEKALVNVCDWYGMLTPEILHAFEAETGIKVQYDVFDNNEVLEAKLLASNSGYDVVFPSASPYVARQIQVGIYQPLNKELLPNLKDMNHFIVDKMKAIDPNISYAIPYYWGTLGIALDKDKIQKALPGVALDSYDLIFKPENLAKLQQCGVSFLEEAVDMFPQAQQYLGLDPADESDEALQKVHAHLMKLRPHIKRFTSARFTNDLIMGDLCIAMAWSGEAHLAAEEVKSMNRTIVYVIPKEGAALWIDCIAIPVGAPHPKNAHAFINFLLRPDIAAKITNSTRLPTLITTALPFINADIRNDPTIYPSPAVMQKMHMNAPLNTPQSQAYDKKRNKMWTMIRLNRQDNK